MTIDEWLTARGATAPPHLLHAVRGALGDDLAADLRDAPERCVAAAARLIAALLESDRPGRDSALTLLAADALATYAFEAAADAPEELDVRASAAMRALAGAG